MKIASLNLRKEPHYRRGSVEMGLKRLGYTVGSHTRPLGKDSLLVIWNRKKGAEEAAADRWEAQGGIVLVMENGYLQKVDKSHYAISVHGHNGSGWFPVGTEDRFTPLGFPLKPMRNGGTEVLVRGQRGIGSLLMASPPQWGEKFTAKLRAKGINARHIGHPGNFVPKVPPIADMKNASHMHIWCSAMGVLALTEGIPVTHHAPHWICAGLEREPALRRMAHGQWRHEEIASGEPFARILDNLGSIPKWR